MESYNLIILEDSQSTNNLLRDSLLECKSIHFNIYQAYDIKSAVRLLKKYKNSINYMLIDLILPDGDGEELIRKISKSTLDLKVIALTIDEDLQRRENLFKYGVIDYFLKTSPTVFIADQVIKTIINLERNKNIKILVVDDSAVVRSYIEDILKNRNYQIITSSNGADAITILEQDPTISMLTLDLEMPQMDGKDVVFELRHKEKFFNLPILILSGTKDKDLIVRTIKNGANDFMKKPFSIEEFVLKCESLINLASTQNEIYLLNKNLEERVKLELEKNREKDKVMIQQSRLASMGEMISNIAHQWRQPLSSLSLIVQDVHDAYQHDELDREYLDNATDSSIRIIDFMSKTIDDFRNFFKPNKSKSIFKINELIDETLELVNATFRSKEITVKKFLLENDAKVLGYPNEFSQVILNILKNAQDILTERDVKNRLVVVKSSIKKDRVIISIEDNAGGIKLENIHKVFDPYFSTKHKAQGTGIGLYMSKQIIESHMRGILNVKNSETGAIFEIKLKYEE